MGGGLMQLVAYGAQDVYLTGNPQITFFKVVYRRHTNFSMEAIEQTFNGTAGCGRKVTCTISRNGDLMSRIYVQANFKPLSTIADCCSSLDASSISWADNLGYTLLKSVEIDIGGQKIDKQYGEWMYIWNELTLGTNGVGNGLNRMVGRSPCEGVCGDNVYFESNNACRTLYIPLEFWFCRNPGLALPLIALQYHEVKLHIEFAPAEDVVIGHQHPTTEPLQAASLWVDYIYLDTDERRRFAQVSHEYLIEQLQYTGAESVTSQVNNIKLNLNHPCKELVFVAHKMNSEFPAFNYTTKADCDHPEQVNYNVGICGFRKAKLMLNGHDRFSEREGMYFDTVQPYQHHSNVPASRGICVYSFGLKPEEHQPSGTCNMSRIDNATLHTELEPEMVNGCTAEVRVFAVSYNVLRIMSGMGGLAYSN